MSEPLPFSLGRGVASAGRSLGDRYRQMQDQIRSAAAQAGQVAGDVGEAYSGGSLFGIPLNPVNDALDAFGAGVRGEATPGQDIPLMQERTSLLEPTKPLAIEEALAQRSLGGAMFGDVDQNNVPVPSMEQSAPPPGRVQATINGKTYDYSGGRQGGAPLAGGQLGSLFGKTWSNEPSDQTHEFAGEGNGAYSQMTENQSLKSLQQLKDEQALADAQPSRRGGSVGEQRGIAQSIEEKRAAADALAQGQITAERGRSDIRLDEQEARRSDYETAIAQEVNDYQSSRAALEASSLPDDKKAQRLAEAQARHEMQRQTIREAFGFGSNLSAALRQD